MYLSFRSMSVPESSEQAFILQEDWRKDRINQIGAESWITVYEIAKAETERLTIYSALVPNRLVKQVLGNPRWDLSIGDGLPGCAVYYNTDGKEKRRIVYEHFGKNNRIMPLVIHRTFYGLREPYNEVLEEFRLFHNLYFDPNNRKYLKFKD